MKVDDKGNPLILVDQLCQAYHWTFAEAMKMTMPQIIMLNHAAHVNAKRMGLDRDEDDVPVEVGGKSKSMDVMDSKDYERYYSDWR